MLQQQAPPITQADPGDEQQEFPEETRDLIDTYLRCIFVPIGPRGKVTFDQGEFALSYERASDTASTIRLKFRQFPAGFTTQMMVEALEAESKVLYSLVLDAFRPDESTMIRAAQATHCEVGWLS